MSNTQTRPSLAKKHTRKSEEGREDVLNAGARIKIDDVWHEARLGDVTPTIGRELRTATGMSFMKLLGTLGEDPDLDVLQAFVFVARRIKGEVVSIDDVAVSYEAIFADDFEVVAAGAEEVDAANPEA